MQIQALLNFLVITRLNELVGKDISDFIVETEK